MLQKFALAFKTKTIEFFAEEDEEGDGEGEGFDLSAAPLPISELAAAPEEVITGQRVVVLRPDPIPRPSPYEILPAIFASLTSFHAAYLLFQTSHSPLRPDCLRSADLSAVSHLHRLSNLKRSYLDESTPNVSLSTHLEAQVRENQSLLRAYETFANKLQADIDLKDAEADALRDKLKGLQLSNSKLSRRFERVCAPADEKVEALLTVGVFDSVLRDSCRVMHRFARILIDMMMKAGWKLDSVANSIYPGVNYAKPGHCRYAILSYVCMVMFDGFDSDDFSVKVEGIEADAMDVRLRRRDSLVQFIEHSSVDPLELIIRSPDCIFSKFCENKYRQLIHSQMENAMFGNSDHGEELLGSLHPSCTLYEPFVSMASSLWMLHKLARAYDPAVEIFQAGQGVEFSMVYMENVAKKATGNGSECGKVLRPKVGFTVVPGFRVGKTSIQCRVYLDGLKQAL